MKNHKVAWLITILLVVVAIAFGQFKAPVQQSDSFYVTDKANLLRGAESQIQSACIDLLQDTGARMVIVTVKHTGLKSMESYTETLWDSWKLSGIDMLLVMKSDDYYFLYGSELWEKLDNSYRTLLDRHLEPKFAVKDYDGAVQDFIAGARSVLLSAGNPDYEQWDDTFYFGGFSMGGLLTGLLIVVVILVVVSAFSKARPASKRQYYGGYASPSAGSFMGTMGRAATRSAMNTMNSTIRRSAASSRPASRPASRPSSFGGGSRGGSFGGGGGRGGGSRGGGGRR